MKIVCTTENLRAAVVTTERFTGKHITLAILSHILIKVSEKRVSFIGTNLETGIEHTIPSKIQKPGMVTAPAKPLSQLIQSLSDQTITLEGHQQKLTLHTLSSDTTLLGLNPDEFPRLPLVKEEHSCTITSSLFTSALHQVLPAVAVSSVKPELSGVFFSASPGTLVLAATDSFRLAEKTLTQLDGVRSTFECIVPARTLQELLRTLPTDADVALGVGEHQITFSWNNTRILSRLIDGAYPPYKNIIPTTYETTLSVGRAELLQKVRLAAVFSSRLNDVSLRFSPTELEVITENAETGGTSARLSTKGRGVPGSAMFNYRYLLDGVEAAGGENTELSINGTAKPTLIRNTLDPSYFYILMPIRSV